MLIVRAMTRTFSFSNYNCIASTFQFQLPKHSQQTHVKPDLCQRILLRNVQMKAGNNKNPSFVPHYEWDKVPRNFSLIYSSSLRHWISVTNVGLSVLAASVCGLSAYNLSRLTFGSLQTMDCVFLCGVPFVITTLMTAWSFLSQPVLIRIYHNAESGRFIGVRRTLFGQLKQIDYTLEDISVKPGNRKTNEAWDSVSLSIKNNPVFLLSSDFVSLSFYNMHVNGQFHSEKSYFSTKDRFF